MSLILIFSDNEALIKLWSAALAPHYQIKKIDSLEQSTKANAVIIDSLKIDNDPHLLSFFSLKSIRFLIVGNQWPEANQIQALVQGAAGYCSGSEPPELLLQAVKSILKGDIWIQRHLVPKVIGTLITMKSAPKYTDEKQQAEIDESIKLLESLSNREMDVAKMIRSGENNKTIASSLHISERTVKAHLTSIFKKLNVPDRLHLALFIKEFI